MMDYKAIQALAPQNMHELVSTVATNPEVQEALKSDPAATVSALTQALPLRNDPWIYRILVSGLVLTVLGCVIGGVWLSMYDKDSPAVILSLGSGAVGALAGLLVPSPAKQ